MLLCKNINIFSNMKTSSSNFWKNSIMVLMMLMSTTICAFGNTKLNNENATELPQTNTETVEVMAEFPGGMMKLMDFLAKNMKYPDEAQDLGISGRVLVSFQIDIDGKITEIQPIKIGNCGGDGIIEIAENRVQEYKESVEAKGKKVNDKKLEKVRKANIQLLMEAARIIREMPDWKPATKNGEPVKSKFVLPINFRLN